MANSESDRRSQILDAALGCFLERGYKATTIGAIRGLSGASTGSIYHFFANKAALARALLERAVAGWAGASAGAENPEMEAETAIKGSVGGLVRWGEKNVRLLRFIDEIRSLAPGDPELSEVRELLEAGQSAGEARYSAFAERGAVRPLPWPVARALMLGASYEYLRVVAAGAKPVPGAAASLADAAWAAVRAEPPDDP